MAWKFSFNLKKISKWNLILHSYKPHIQYLLKMHLVIKYLYFGFDFLYFKVDRINNLFIEL